MANREKKEATEALDELSNYLRRDRNALPKLEAINRYIGSLRQTQTAMKSEIEAAASRNRSLLEAETAATADLARLQTELQQTKAQLAQAKSDLTAATARNEDLRRQLEPPEIPAEATKGCLIDEVRYMQLLKCVQRARRAAPQPLTTRVNVEDRFALFDIRDLCDDFSGDDCMRLGQFVAACVLMHFPIAIIAEGHGREHKAIAFEHQIAQPDDARLRFIRWIDRWMREPEWKEKIAQATWDKASAGIEEKSH